MKPVCLIICLAFYVASFAQADPKVEFENTVTSITARGFETVVFIQSEENTASIQLGSATSKVVKEISTNNKYSAKVVAKPSSENSNTITFEGVKYEGQFPAIFIKTDLGRIEELDLKRSKFIKFPPGFEFQQLDIKASGVMIGRH
ncbi:MAG: hypothetical protein KTR13_05130 [Saprospiraceae bacterium]|nr:hypothetical protein [Saprospiraceae bacterium]